MGGRRTAHVRRTGVRRRHDDEASRLVAGQGCCEGERRVGQGLVDEELGAALAALHEAPAGLAVDRGEEGGLRLRGRLVHLTPQRLEADGGTPEARGVLPRHRVDEARAQLLHRRAPVARVEHQRLHIVC